VNTVPESLFQTGLAMKKNTMVWDFDGTLLPIDPYDSEQSLLVYQMQQTTGKFSFHEKLAARSIIYADKKEWLPGKYFKWPYARLLKGTPVHALDRVAEGLAQKISAIDRSSIRELAGCGYDMLVVSCGTADLIQRVLEFAGIAHNFSHILANCFIFKNNRIDGMRYSILTPEDKLAALATRHIRPEACIAVGDGYTDIPLLDKASVPILMDPTGGKHRLVKAKGYHTIASIPELIPLLTVS
jgi:phosphoserine phosphatase